MMTTELEHERRMLREGEEQFWMNARRVSEHHVTTRHGAGAIMLVRAVTAVATEIEKWRKQAKTRPGPISSLLPYLDTLPTAVVAFTACRAVLDAVAEKRELGNVAARLGRKLQDEDIMRCLKREHPREWARCWQRLSKFSSYRNKAGGFILEAKKLGVAASVWPVRDRVRLGTFLVEMVRTYTGLVDVLHTTARMGGNRVRTRAVLVPTRATLDWLSRTNGRLSVLHPSMMPMIEPPRPWTTLYDGGYYLPELSSVAVRAAGEHLDMLDDALRVAIEEPTVEHNTSDWLKATNVAQAVPWRVNQHILAVATKLWNAGGNLAGLPRRTPEELPPYPPDDDMDARMAWRKLARRVHLERTEQSSPRLSVIRQLGLATEFSGKAMYFPHRCDFRGRLYSVSSVLQPQGNDLARGLLEFASSAVDVSSDTARRWLAIHLANCYGVDKVTFNQRVGWVDEHALYIRATTLDPEHEGWWMQADSPWQFLAACFAWCDQRALARLPIAIDGSNNGLQLFAMLSRDPATAEATNCVPTDVPQDVYQRVADRVWARLDVLGNMSGPGIATADELREIRCQARRIHALIEGIWGRKAVKRPVMTLPYGATKHSCSRYIKEWFAEATDGSRWIVGCNKDLAALANIVWDEMAVEMPGALELMAWMRGVATVFAKADPPVPLWWLSPSGFLVRQEYPKRAGGRVKTVMRETVRFTRFKEDVADTLDVRRQANGFPPNFVHSLDAGILHNVVLCAAAEGITNLRLIHDSFATTADNIGRLGEIVRRVFVDTFRGDPLKVLTNTLRLQAPAGVVVPDPPTLGSLDVTLALHATYLFS